MSPLFQWRSEITYPSFVLEELHPSFILFAFCFFLFFFQNHLVKSAKLASWFCIRGKKFNFG